MSEEGKRRHPRFTRVWTVEINAAEWRDVLQLSTENVSRGGLFVCGQDPLPMGTRVEITLVLPDETVFQAEGAVAHRVSPESAEQLGRPPGFGVCFDERYLSELALLEVMARSEVGDEPGSDFDEDDVMLPAVLRDGAGEPQPTVVYADQDQSEPAPEEPSAAELAPPPVNLMELDETPAPPPADAELARSGVYQRPDLSAELGDKAPRTPAATGGPSPTMAEAVPEGVGEPTAEPAAMPPPLPVQPRPRPAVPETPPIFGIDFGTSFTSIAVVRGDRVALLEDEDSSTLTPSVVCYPDEGPPLVGWEAREKALIHPTTTFRSPKRLIGRRYKDKRVEPFLGASPVRTQEGPNGQVVADVYGELIAIPQVCAHIFERVARIGQAATGAAVKNILLSAPVSFDKERVAIKRAAELAGLHVVGVIDEPVAAAMAYGLVRAGDGLVAVYDFGGGTFDFTVLEIKGGKSTVVGEAGDDWLGGDDFDRAIAEAAANMFWRKHNVDLRKRAVEWERLLMYCEQAKRKLSVGKEFDLHVKGIVLSVRGGIDLKMRLDRQIFADLCGELVERTLEVVDSCLELLEIQPSAINQLVLTGGVTRIPLVRVRVQEYFKQKARMAVNPEHAIVLGNAIYGHVIRLRSRTAASA